MKTTLYAGLMIAAGLLAGCASTGSVENATPENAAGGPKKASPRLKEQKSAEDLQAEALTKEPATSAAALASDERFKVKVGTGVVVRKPAPSPEAPASPTDVSLMYEAADVREVVKNILFDILGENYNIDPQVAGQVTFRTVKPLARSALLPTLETILRMNGHVLIKEDGIFKVVPAAIGIKGSTHPQFGATKDSLPPGFSVQIVPLKHIGAKEMARVLEPFQKDASSLRIDELRNLLILSGTERELRHLLETVEMFDVDLLSGMSFGLFPLRNADVKAVEKEYKQILGEAGVNPLHGLVRVIPVERLNALLVISPQPTIVEQAKQWMERLDTMGGSGEARLHVYNMHYGRADKIAPLLTQVLTGRAPPAAPSAPTVAPGQTGTQMSSPTPTPAPAPAPVPAASSSAAAQGAGLAAAKNVQIVADKDNNALVILATTAEYAIVESALRKLDVPPKQVLIEAKLARVALSDDFQLGLQWYFSNGGRLAGGLRLFGDKTPSDKVPINYNGLSYIWSRPDAPGSIGAAFNMLASDSRTTIISTPHTIVQDNQAAQIQIGSKVPTLTQTQSQLGTGTGTNPVTTNSVQYQDTGIMLKVTPRINASGQVTLELEVEISSAEKNKTGGIDSPVINKTSAKSTITTLSGESVLLGGLIEEQKGRTSSGLPLLSKIPVIGGLFGEQTRTGSRSELVILVTPKLLDDLESMRAATSELRGKMRELGNLLPVGAAAVGTQPVQRRQ